MRRLSLPLGPLDTSTRDGALTASGLAPPDGALRLRHARGVVPDPSGSGYVVPEPAEALHTLPSSRTAIAAAWYYAPRRAAGPVAEKGARGADASPSPATEPHLVVVTDADVRLVRPGGAATALYVFAEADAARSAQFAPLGDALYVAGERGDGTPEPPLVVATVDVGGEPTPVALPFQGEGADGGRPRPWLPDATLFDLDSEPPDGVAGLDPGLYAVRFAAIHRDGSTGPAGLPRLHLVSRPVLTETAPYELGAAASADDETITVAGTAAYDEFVEWLGVYGAAGVPVHLVPYVVRGTSAEVVAGDTVVTLAEPLSQGFAAGQDVIFGDRARLRVRSSGGVFPEGLSEDEAGRLYRGVAVLLSAPLSSAEEALDAPYFRLDEIELDDPATTIGLFYTRVVDTKTLTTAGLLARASFREGALAGGLRASRVGSHAGRLLFGGVAFDPPPPRDGLLFALGNAAADPEAGTTRWFVLAVEIETGAGTLRRWSEPIPTEGAELDLGGSALGGLLYYPDAQAARVLVYRDAAGGGDYRLAETVALRPSATHNAAVATTDAALGDVADGDRTDPLPSAAEREADNRALDGSPRRLAVTGAGRPAELRAERVLEVGASEADRVQGVVPLAEAVSEGQFGSFPLVVLCRDSVWTLGTDAEGEVTGAQLYTAARGCVSPHAFVSDGRRVYHVADDGLYAVGSDAPLSSALTTEAGRPPAGVAVQPLPDATTALGLFHDGARRELWLAAGGTDGARYVWVLDARSIGGTPRWSVLGRDRAGFAAYGAAVEAHRPLVSLTAGGLCREAAGSSDAAAAADPREALRPVASTDRAARGGLPEAEDGEPEDVAIVTATLSPADGLPVVLRRLGLVGDPSAPVTVEVVERALAGSAPGDRAARAEAVVLRLVVAPEQAGEFHALCRVAHVALALTATGLQPGDRLDAAEATFADRVRSRRHRHLLPR